MAADSVFALPELLQETTANAVLPHLPSFLCSTIFQGNEKPSTRELVLLLATEGVKIEILITK
jgi:hypothetical protein